MTPFAETVLSAIDRLIEANTALRKSRALAKPEQQLERAMAKAFRAQGRVFLERFARLKQRYPPELREVAESDWVPIFDEAALETVQVFQQPLNEFTARALESGMLGALADLGIEDAFDLKHPRAVEVMTQLGAERVTQITDTTRDYLRALLTQAADEGWSYDKTARAIRKRYADFSVKRARNIAVYELGNAYEAGNLLVAKDLQSAGLTMEKQWLLAANPCAVCQSNAAEGWIPLDQAFSGGVVHAPQHVNCRCATLHRRQPTSGQ